MIEERDTLSYFLPKYDEIREALEKAVEKTLTEDWDLVALGCHEQAIAHRTAIYIEQRFPLYHTDCEYNRRKHKIKDFPAEKGTKKKMFRPDIIVHIRNSIDNVLAVEMKANANKSKSNDLVKLKHLYSDAEYLYKATAFVKIHNSKKNISKGRLKATISWYNVRENELEELSSQKKTVESLVDKKLILSAYRWRKNKPIDFDYQPWPAYKRLEESFMQ